MPKIYNFARICILIADPSKYMRSLLVELTRSFGFRTIIQAANGADALNVLNDQNVDIVLVDGPMEPIDGFQFTNRVRRSSPKPFLPIIMVSAHTCVHEVIRARDAGVTEFLAKPISAKTLLMRLCAVVDHQRAFVRSKGFVGPDRRRHMDQAFKGPERRSILSGAKAGAVLGNVDARSEPTLTQAEIKALMTDEQ